MLSSSPAVRAPRRAAAEPNELPAIVQDAVNCADVDAFVTAHADDATVVMPPDGATAVGRDEIRAGIVSLFSMQPRLRLVPGKTLRAGELALTHGRWQLTLVDAGSRIELGGLGTMVSRRSADGTWHIVLDDPLTRP